MRSYYNTTHLQGEDLKKAIQKAASQEDAILIMFKNVRKPYSPSKVMELMQRAGYNWPITSIRRSITNLTKDGALEKTASKVKGMYGEMEHQWQLNYRKYPSAQPQQGGLFDAA